MEQQEFLVSEELHFPSINDVLSDESSVKREELKDDDLLLFAQLDTITNLAASTSNCSLSAEIKMGDPFQKQLPITSNEIIQVPQNKNDTMLVNNNKQLVMTKNDSFGYSTSHYVRYKLQDGKHIKVWECGICSKEFTHQYTLMRHLPTHTDERKFQCNTCGKAFRQMSTLSQHRAIHSTERPYICEICQKTFNRVSTLISHRKTHTGLKPHRCYVCSKAFHQKGNLRNHIFTHTNERPYKCDICEKGFNQMSNLMCHKLKAHQRTEKPKYVCSLCGKSFPKRMGLRQHEQFTHGMIAEPVSLPQTTEKINYMNAILVDPIKTEAMRLALESNQTPFALLRPLSGIPVLVRVLPAGDKQMLVPASADDLRKHSHISITTKEEQENAKANGKAGGSTVQIKIPVVATVIQQNDHAGQLSMSVISPGPNGEFVDQPGLSNSKVSGLLYSSTLTNPYPSTELINLEDSTATNNFSMSNINIEFLDERGRPIMANQYPNLKAASFEIDYKSEERNAFAFSSCRDQPDNITIADAEMKSIHNSMDIEKNIF